MSGKFTFTSKEKLKSRKRIGQIFEQGQSFSNFPFRIVYIFPKDDESVLQAAFSVSTKGFKRAVDRNRIKRLMREAYRLEKQSLKNLLGQNQLSLAVFIIYVGKELPSYQLVHDKTTAFINRLVEIVKRKCDDQQE